MECPFEISRASSDLIQKQARKQSVSYGSKHRKTALALAMAAALAFPALSLSAPGDPVGGEFEVITASFIPQKPTVSLDDDGDFVVVWHSNNSPLEASYAIYAQRYNNAGVVQGSEFRVNTFAASHQRNPAVALDADGDFVVTWQSYGQDGSTEGVYAQRFNNAGVPQGLEFRVNTTAFGAQSNPDVALDADGDFVVTWESFGQDGDGFGIYARRFNNAGVAQGGEFRVNSTGTGIQRLPAVAVDADGDFVVAWQSDGQDGSDYGIYAQRYNNLGVPQGGEFRANFVTTNRQNNPVVALDADGDFVVAWQSRDQDGSSYGIYGQRFNRTGTFQGNEFRANTFTTDSQLEPALGIDADGDFVIAWQSQYQDGSNSGVYAQRYNPAGLAQGGEFRVNTTTSGSQTIPAVALDADGDFAVAWLSFYQDGNFTYGIFAQRFEGAGSVVLCGGLPTTLLGTPLNDLLIGTTGDDVIAGLGGSDVIYGLEGNDRLCGGDDNDLLLGRAGNDLLDGGPGLDSALFGGSANITANLGTNTASGEGNDTLADIENLAGSSGNDSLTGNGGNNILNGGLGNDQLNGAGGMDTALFFSAAFTIAVAADLNTGGATGQGNDTMTSIENLVGSNGNDILTGNAVSNILFGLGGNDTLVGMGGDDTLRGNNGIDTASFPGAAGVIASLTSGIATGQGSDTMSTIEGLIGSSAADTLTGSSGNDFLNGGPGNDTIDGAGGIDTVSFVGPTGVIVNLGAGTASGQGSDTLSSLENIIGSSGNDILTGNILNNLLFGLEGNDTLNGDAGNDALDGGPQTDTCNGDAQLTADTAVNCETVTGVP